MLYPQCVNKYIYIQKTSSLLDATPHPSSPQLRSDQGDSVQRLADSQLSAAVGLRTCHIRDCRPLWLEDGSITGCSVFCFCIEKKTVVKCWEQINNSKKKRKKKNKGENVFHEWLLLVVLLLFLFSLIYLFILLTYLNNLAPEPKCMCILLKYNKTVIWRDNKTSYLFFWCVWSVKLFIMLIILFTLKKWWCI